MEKKKKNLAGLLSFWGSNLPELERGTPQSILTFPTPPMYLFNPIS